MMTEPKPVSIILVDDHPMFRQGLQSLISHEPHLHVIAVTGDGRSILNLVRVQPPDLIVMDITLPGMSGIQATRQILAEFPLIKIIALSIHNNLVFVEEMLNAGARGYVLKSSAFEELLLAIQQVLNGNLFLSENVKECIHLPDQESPMPLNSNGISQLTAREREVLQLIAEGNSSKDISETLHITLKTVEKHRHCIKSKLNLHSTAELTKYAIRTCLTSVEF